MKYSKFPVITALLLSSLGSISGFAAEGTHTGGGGDASEARVNEIRADILKWISEGGAQRLKLPAVVTYEQYVKNMNQILAQNAVVVGFTNQPVLVSNQEKTCRGLISKLDRRTHMDCNIARFTATSPADQYRLVHHEYAGLAGVERNDDASSDYSVSSQITSYLVAEMVLRLAVKPPGSNPSSSARFVWDIDVYGQGYLSCFPEDSKNLGYLRPGSYAVESLWCNAHPGSFPGGHPTFVWGFSKDRELRCFLEDPRRPGFPRPGIASLADSFCFDHPGSSPGGNPTFVWDVDANGSKSCFMENPKKPGSALPGTYAVRPIRCEVSPGGQ